jgi:hypothetical protein
MQADVRADALPEGAGSPPRKTGRTRLVDPHNPHVGFFVYPRRPVTPSTASTPPMAPLSSSQGAAVSPPKNDVAVESSALPVAASPALPMGLAAFCHLRMLQKHARRQRRAPRTSYERRSSRKTRRRLPAHNPFVGFFSHSLRDPILQFLSDCAPATPSDRSRASSCCNGSDSDSDSDNCSLNYSDNESHNDGDSKSIDDDSFDVD